MCSTQDPQFVYRYAVWAAHIGSKVCVQVRCVCSTEDLKIVCRYAMCAVHMIYSSCTGMPCVQYTITVTQSVIMGRKYIFSIYIRHRTTVHPKMSYTEVRLEARRKEPD